MGKSPAFQFYPNDWTRDTAMLPLEVKGAWVDILCAMWWNEDRGKVSGSYEDFGRLLRTDSEKSKQIIDHLTEKKVCDITKYNVNITLISRRMVREEKERKNNLLRQKRYQEKHVDNEELQKYNANITPPSSIPSSSSKKKNIKPTSRIEIIRLCDSLKLGILKNNPNAKVNEKSWHNDCRLMLDRDKRPESEIEAVIRYSQADDFWKCNILSMRSLRNKYDRLFLKMKSDKGNGSGGTPGRGSSLDIESAIKQQEDKKNEAVHS